MLAGVAGGVAEMVDADPSIIRIVWALLVFLTGGLALVVYVVMAIVVPERPDGVDIGRARDATAGGASGTAGTPWTSGPVPGGGWVAPDGSVVPMAPSPSAGRGRHRDPADRARGGLIAGLLLILVGGFFLVRQFVPSIDLGFWWPTVAIGLGVLLIILALIPSRRSG